MYPNVTFIHDNGVTSVDREVRDYTAHLKETAVAPGYGRRMYSARTDTRSYRPADYIGPQRAWVYRRKYAGGSAYDPAIDKAFEAQQEKIQRQDYVAMKMATGVKPRNRAQYDEMMDQLDPAQQDVVEDLASRYESELEEQTGAARDAARPYAVAHADRVTNWQKRNPGRDKTLDPLGNPNEQQRLALEQSARFLPAELLHMVRPDRRPDPPLDQHPGYNSIPARTIRDRNSAAVPANYVHH